MQLYFKSFCNFLSVHLNSCVIGLFVFSIAEKLSFAGVGEELFVALFNKMSTNRELRLSCYRVFIVCSCTNRERKKSERVNYFALFTCSINIFILC